MACISYFALCVTELDFPTKSCIYIKKKVSQTANVEPSHEHHSYPVNLIFDYIFSDYPSSFLPQPAPLGGSAPHGGPAPVRRTNDAGMHAYAELHARLHCACKVLRLQDCPPSCPAAPPLHPITLEEGGVIDPEGGGLDREGGEEGEDQVLAQT